MMARFSVAEGSKERPRKAMHPRETTSRTSMGEDRELLWKCELERKLCSNGSYADQCIWTGLRWIGVRSVLISRWPRCHRSGPEPGQSRSHSTRAEPDR